MTSIEQTIFNNVFQSFEKYIDKDYELDDYLYGRIIQDNFVLIPTFKKLFNIYKYNYFNGSEIDYINNIPEYDISFFTELAKTYYDDYKFFINKGLTEKQSLENISRM